jgi:hypothetical protein
METAIKHAVTEAAVESAVGKMCPCEMTAAHAAEMPAAAHAAEMPAATHAAEMAAAATAAVPATTTTATAAVRATTTTAATVGERRGCKRERHTERARDKATQNLTVHLKPSMVELRRRMPSQQDDQGDPNEPAISND